jgi:hypothetical protein
VRMREHDFGACAPQHLERCFERWPMLGEVAGLAVTEPLVEGEAVQARLARERPGTGLRAPRVRCSRRSPMSRRR